MPKSYFLYGNITHDHNIISGKKYSGLGGSVYFLAKILKNLGENVSIFTSYGADLPIKRLQRINIVPELPTCKKSLVFRNVYLNQTRNQSIRNHNCAELPKLDNTTLVKIQTADAVIIAPLLNNLKESEIDKIIKPTLPRLKVLLPQGFFRKISAGSNIIFRKWVPNVSFLNYFDLMILSDKDTPDADKFAQFWAKYGLISIVTKESLGCTIYYTDTRLDISAFKIDQIVDSTGAGDVFAAAFCHAYIRSKNLKKAAIFANAAAGLSLRFLPNQLQYGKPEIIRLIKSQSRKFYEYTY